MAERRFFVYIMGSRSRNLYTGITNNLERRVHEHKRGLVAGFTRRYRIDRLMHFEVFSDVRVAVARGKQIKAWNRAKRIALIEASNPTWGDLAEEWEKRWQRAEEGLKRAKGQRQVQIPRPTKRASG